jgi:hypothetical protein
VLQNELAKLQDPAVVQARAQLDQSRYDLAAQGTPVMISKEARLMKRYQAMHARRRREAWQEFERIRLGLRRWPEELQEKLAKLAHDQYLQELKARASSSAAQPAQPSPASAAAAPTAASAAPKAAPTAPKPSTLPWGYEYNAKYARAAQNGPARDREAERAKKKDERKARNKQQKQQKQR